MKKEKVIDLDVKKGYDKWSKTYDTDKNPLIVLEERNLSDSIGNVKNKIVLDVGCGTGRITTKLLRKGAKVFGIDVSPEMLSKAKEKTKKYGSKCEFRIASAYKIPYERNKFDLVVCNLVLSHLKNLNKAMTEISRVLKVKGFLVISDISPEAIRYGARTNFLQNDREYKIANYYHSLEEIFSTFKKSNLAVLELKEPIITKKICDITISLYKKYGKPIPHKKEYKQWIGHRGAIIIKAFKFS